MSEERLKKTNREEREKAKNIQFLDLSGGKFGQNYPDEERNGWFVSNEGEELIVGDEKQRLMGDNIFVFLVYELN